MAPTPWGEPMPNLTVKDGSSHALTVTVSESHPVRPLLVWLQSAGGLSYGHSEDLRLSWDEWDRLEAWVELQRAEFKLG